MTETIYRGLSEKDLPGGIIIKIYGYYLHWDFHINAPVTDFMSLDEKNAYLAEYPDIPISDYDIMEYQQYYPYVLEANLAGPGGVHADVTEILELYHHPTHRPKPGSDGSLISVSAGPRTRG